MIPEYKRDRKHGFNVQDALENMPEMAELIARQNTWDEFEQKPDFSDIPAEYQGMIPDNILGIPLPSAPSPPYNNRHEGHLPLVHHQSAKI